MTPDQAAQVFVDPSAYADEAHFHEACAVLRREAPLHLVEHPEFLPFRVVVRHADVMEVETNPAVFNNAPRPIISTHQDEAFRKMHGDLFRTLIHMDDPDHRLHRMVTADWFQPRSLGRYHERFAELARRAVDRMAELDGECDFAQDVAMQFPLNGILALLGLPESDYPRMLKLTQELFGASDPEMGRGQELVDLIAVVGDFFAYFFALTAERRARPGEDLASVIANSTVDGKPMGDMETISYYVIVATAGHDTTSSSIAGGLQALAEHPDQLARLQADMSLLPTAVDEMIRWVTPVKHFMRNATTDFTLAGTEIVAGEALLLSYPSANRDEAVFEDPFRFDVGRTPNRHMAFGFGVHYCLGAQFARMEMRALFNELLPRLEFLELAA
ncbi:MAG: cytochrome P450, partial [Acidimicrobiia bacterium]